MVEFFDGHTEYFRQEEINYRSYEYFGVHRDTRKYVFRVWAPHADSVYLVSDATGWDDGIDMVRVKDSGVWEIRLYTYKGIKNEKIHSNIEGMRYRYKIVSDGEVYFRCDPYSFSSHICSSDCSEDKVGKSSQAFSVVYTRSSFKFSDLKWRNKIDSIVAGKGFYSEPINVYEVHLGSFLRKNGDDGYLNYKDIADKLVPYIKQMGYTHVQLMPVAEYLSEASCGYHVLSYYSPTSRYGSPDDFKYLVNKLHLNGIGVILDWVPAHFSKEQCGLYRFDGSPLYEYSNDLLSSSPWGTCYFDVKKQNVKNFLISNISYWIEEYHIDGVRFEAVSSMLYLDYDKADGQWVPNKYGSNENIDAIDFIKQINYHIHKNYPHVFTVADESSIWNGVTHDIRADGLGFTFKSNVQWSEDMLEYMGTDPWFRKEMHSKLTFPMMYFFNEHYILPISHNQVASGKGSLIDKMYGCYDDKFSNLKAFMTMQMTYPGKKLLFMGCEYGQFKEWNSDSQLEWFMLDFEKHAKLQRFAAELNHRYLRDSRLYSDDYSWNGFKWIYPDLADKNVIAYRRFNRTGDELIVVVNFSGASWNDFVIPVNADCIGCDILLNSQSEEFGGNFNLDNQIKTYVNGGQRVVSLETLPPLCALIIEPSNNATSPSSTIL